MELVVIRIHNGFPSMLDIVAINRRGRCIEKLIGKFSSAPFADLYIDCEWSLRCGRGSRYSLERSVGRVACGIGHVIWDLIRRSYFVDFARNYQNEMRVATVCFAIAADHSYWNIGMSGYLQGGSQDTHHVRASDMRDSHE
jgi:hypothetical protein